MEYAFHIALQHRKIFYYFLQNLSLEELNRIPEGFKNNIFWNIAHCIATQQILVYRYSSVEPLVSEAFIDTYKKGTKPEQEVSEKEVNEVSELLFSTLEKTQQDLQSQNFKEYQPYTTSTKTNINSTANAIEFNNFHEGIHLGYILALRKAIGAS